MQPSNSLPKPPESGVLQDLDIISELGIDFLGLGIDIYPVSPSVFEGNETRYISPGGCNRSTTVLIEVAGIESNLHVQTRFNGYEAFLEFNPARWKGNARCWDGLAVAHLPEVLALIEAEVRDIIDPVGPHPTWQVRRLDLARSYNVHPVDQRALLTGWNRVPTRARARNLWADSKGTPQSLAMSTKSRGQVIAYDHNAKHGTSPPHTFRVEVQARKEWCKRYAQIETITDISPSSTTDLYKDRITWAGLNTPVMQHNTRVRLLHEHAEEPDTDLTTRQLPGLLGREVLAEAGIDPHKGNSTSARDRAVTMATGVAHVQPDGPHHLRLDPHVDAPIYEVAA